MYSKDIPLSDLMKLVLKAKNKKGIDKTIEKNTFEICGAKYRLKLMDEF